MSTDLWPDWNSPEYTMTAEDGRRDRFGVEERKLLAAFSTVIIAKQGGRITRIAGSIEPLPGVIRDFKIIVPERYPYEPPVALSVGWACTGKHRFSDSEMCLWRKNLWSPRYTLGYAVAKTFVWIHKHEVYRSTHKWPGREQDH
ncbi:hypothetical protein OJ998_09970 [Solirubrobacter taibaiensis]|nr:hypothetical protein [Solirubrobacter taibaiensis]